MCVIAYAKEKRPTERMVEQMWEANPHGGGVAWRQENEVHWRKGLNLEDMKRLCAELPIPFVAHFRIPSCGGDNKFLTHPFPITKEVPLSLEGKTKGFVLFHNGHWNRWKDLLLEAAVKQGVKIPRGHWSDTRGMALLASYFSLGILEVIDEKYVAFGAGEHDFEIGGTGWSTIDIEDGKLWVSNRVWEWRGFRRIPNVVDDSDDNYEGYEYMHGGGANYEVKYCRVSNCTKDHLKDSIWCSFHQELHNRHDKSKKSEEVTTRNAAESFRGGSGEVQEGQVVKEEVQDGKTQVQQVDGKDWEGERSLPPIKVNGPHSSHNTALALVSGANDPNLSAEERDLRWVRSLNPSKFRGIPMSDKEATDRLLARTRRPVIHVV